MSKTTLAVAAGGTIRESASKIRFFPSSRTAASSFTVAAWMKNPTDQCVRETRFVPQYRSISSGVASCW